jgi:RNA 2',3'-cyclic 3'-phosphodiesterase
VSSTSSLRLFVAASIPDVQLDWVQEQMAPLKQLWPAARWIPRANQHVTLKFLGTTRSEQVSEVMRACEVAAAGREPSTVGLHGLGVFPRTSAARVLWVGLDDPRQLLAAVADALDQALEPLGFKKENRPYSAHLTVARFRDSVRIAQLPPLASPPPPFPLGSFGLWRSHLSPKGATYEPLAEFALAQVSP